MHSPYRIVWHEPPGNQVRSYRLNLTKVPMFLAIFAWVEDMVRIPSMGFGIPDKLADAMHVPLVRSDRCIHSRSISVQKNTETVITKN